MDARRNPARSLEASRIGVKFAADPWSIRRWMNLATGLPFGVRCGHSFLIRLASRVSDPLFLTQVQSVVETEGGLTLVAADPTGSAAVTLAVTVCDEGLRFDAEVSSSKPLWMAEWRLTGLDLKRVIIPALGGQSIDRRMPQGTTLSYKYPFWWNAQFLIGETTHGGFWLHTREASPRFRLARVRHTASGFDITYGFEADAPLRRGPLRSTWYIDCYRGSWKVPVETHRAWMEKAFRLTDLDHHAALPGWARQITCVLEIWGIGKDSPRPLHTFRQMGARLCDWANLHPPERTLLYLPGFAEHGIDSRAPAYTPSRELGGPEGFRALLNLARTMGYRTMVHTNAVAMTFDHPLFERFRRHQVVDPFGRVQGWGLDIDGDWLAEPYFAYINPGEKDWSDLMVSVIGQLVKEYAVDAVFLDQTLLAFNVSRGPNFVTGMREHIRRLQKEFPAVLFAGEGMHEQVVEVLPMAQIHGIDSIAEVHGAEGRVRWRKAHPVSTHLFGRYTRFTPHLLTRHPAHPIFRLQEAAYAKLGVMPALCLYSNDQAMASPELRAMLRRAKRIGR